MEVGVVREGGKEGKGVYYVGRPGSVKEEGKERVSRLWKLLFK